MDFTFFPVKTSTYIGYIDRLYFNTLSSTTISYFQWGAYKWVKIYNTKHDRNIVSTQNKNQNAKTSYVVKHLATMYRLYRVWTDWKFQIYIASLWDTKPMISNIQNWNLVCSGYRDTANLEPCHYYLHDITRRQKIEINEPASTPRLFQNCFEGAYKEDCSNHHCSRSTFCLFVRFGSAKQSKLLKL
jgi:hypothetical protein